MAVPSIQWWLFLATIPLHPTYWRLICACTITLVTFAGGMDKHSDWEGFFSPLSLARILEETELVIIWIRGTYSSFLSPPPLSPKALCDRLTVASWNRSVFQQQVLGRHLRLSRYQHRGCMSPRVTQQPALAGSQTLSNLGSSETQRTRQLTGAVTEGSFQKCSAAGFQPKALK